MLYQLAAIIPESYVLDYSIRDINNHDTIKEICSRAPEFILCSIGFETYDEDLAFLKQLKEEWIGKIIVFGHYATMNPSIINENDIFDVVIKGEPEPVITDVLKNIDNSEELKKIRGVCLKKYINPKKSELDDLNSLPIPKRDLSKMDDYQNPFALKTPFTTAAVTRGCPHRCVFCTVPVLYNKKLRKRSVENVIKEFQLLKQQGFKELFFRDENLCFDKKYLIYLCRKMINSDFNFSWMCYSRVDCADEELLKWMKKAGCYLIKFGIESGNQKILDNLKKDISLEDAKKIILLCRKLGIETVAHFIIGNPGDTKETINDTIEFAITLDPDYASFDKIIVYPGTELHRTKFTPLSSNLLKHYHTIAFKTFYMRIGKIFQQLSKVKSFTRLKTLTFATITLWSGIIKKKRDFNAEETKLQD